MQTYVAPRPKDFQYSLQNYSSITANLILPPWLTYSGGTDISGWTVDGMESSGKVFKRDFAKFNRGFVVKESLIVKNSSSL